MLPLLVLALSALPSASCDAEAADRLFAELDTAVRATAPLPEPWKRLAEHPCFAPALDAARASPGIEDAELFAAWWSAGGRDWLASITTPSAFTVIPPDIPERPNAREAAGLTLLACAQNAPASCDKATAGWRLRATETLEGPERDHREEEALAKACEATAKKAKKQQAWRTWTACLEEKRPLGARLPFGRFRAPADGWLVLRGRRGHYHFCDEVRAYDLATGAAWVAQSCSGLVLLRGGAVNHDETDAQRGLKVLRGRVPLEALREAVWVTLQAHHVQTRTQSAAWYVRQPAWLKPSWTGDAILGGLGMSGWFSSAQTQLAWSWQGKEGLRDAGTLTWPDSSHEGENYAATLWRIAEAALEEGEPPARPPWPLIGGSAPGVSRIDAEPQQLRSTEAALLEALHAAAMR